jgi:hypothetical protein
VKKLSLSVAALLALSGCYRTVIDTTAPRQQIANDTTGVSWVSLTPVTHKAEECQYGLAKVEAKMPEWGALVWFITGSLIAPMQIEYHCVDPDGVAPGVKKPAQ